MPPQAGYGPPSSARPGEGGPIKRSPLNRARVQVASRINPHKRSRFHLSAQSLSAAEREPAHFPWLHPNGPRLKVRGLEAQRSLRSAPSSAGHQNEAAASSRGPG
ncbi:hypothetical protein NDU88_006842 [Pleurodeles waltl]|uniref:Uncharacterized protein n=1 Tax=Pleurodeles waltl TaxID=8319 RepID=A0AAV7WYQ1_PLEWA|nr:hypothetical protein NDU88_006842 [Pleurodeles waltl]